MKRLDDGKVSLVEFMRSIKFHHQNSSKQGVELSTHFAHLDPQARPANNSSSEDCNLVRSAN